MTGRVFTEAGVSRNLPIEVTFQNVGDLFITRAHADYFQFREIDDRG
jgi:hypothetical protein